MTVIHNAKPERVGFFGTGLMGAPIVRSLMRHGYPVAVWNRTPAKYADLLKEGATAPGSPRAVAATSDILISMLVEPAHLDAILQGDEGILAGLLAGSLFMDMGTGPPPNARRLERLFAEHRASFLDTPVRGGIPSAVEGTLLVMAGGEKAAFSRALPVLESIGRTVIHAGPAGSGQIAKLCHQIAAVVSVEAIAEAMALAGAFGAHQAGIADVLRKGVCASPLMETVCQKIVARNWKAGRPVWLYQKDAANLEETLGAMDLKVPVAQEAFDRIRALMESGGGDLDESSLYTLLDP
jgi:2-hydroxy-3-oxopropionate reductase